MGVCRLNLTGVKSKKLISTPTFLRSFLALEHVEILCILIFNEALIMWCYQLLQQAKSSSVLRANCAIPLISPYDHASSFLAKLRLNTIRPGNKAIMNNNICENCEMKTIDNMCPLKKSRQYFPSSDNKLSVRQKECLELLVCGKKAKEIARTLNLSYRTIEFYVAALKEKFNCSNRIELIARFLTGCL